MIVNSLTSAKEDDFLVRGHLFRTRDSAIVLRSRRNSERRVFVRGDKQVRFLSLDSIGRWWLVVDDERLPSSSVHNMDSFYAVIALNDGMHDVRSELDAWLSSSKC